MLHTSIANAINSIAVIYDPFADQICKNVLVQQQHMYACVYVDVRCVVRRWFENWGNRFDRSPTHPLATNVVKWEYMK